MDQPANASVGTTSQQVDPWSYLIKEVMNMLDTSELEAVLNHMQGTVNDEDDVNDDKNSLKLGRDEKVKQKFEKRMNKEPNFRDTARRLTKAFDFLNYHEKGEKLSSIVNNFLEKYHPEETEVLFVGRDEEITDIKQAFSEGSIKCVIISGPGGVGKTTLAEHVCKQWPSTFKIDMSGKSSTSDLAKDILLNNRKMVSSSHEEIIKDLKLFLKELKGNALIFADDCDLMFSDGKKVNSFLNEILHFLEQEVCVKICFLMTSAVRFERSDLHREETAHLVKQINLDSLRKPAAIELLCKSSGEDIPHEKAEEIVTECACSPLAVRTVASMIRNKKFTICQLLFHLKMDEKNVTTALKVSKCMEVAINSLNDEVKESLYRLVVFQGFSFHRKFAEKVLKTDTPSNDLLILERARLLDFRQGLISDHKSNRDSKERGIYSLQPLVYKYLNESIQREQKSSIKEVIRDAKCKFVNLYEKEISHMMLNIDTKIIKGTKLLEFHKPHIKHFFSLLENEKSVLEPYPTQSTAKEFLKKKMIFELADVIIPDVQKRRLYKSEAARAKSDGNHAMCIHWTVEEAEVYLLSVDKPGLAKELLDELSQNYPALRGLCEDSIYPHFVHALFHKVKGLTLWKLQKPLEGLEHLFLALKFFEHFNTTDPDLPKENQRYDKRYVCLHARMYSAIGQIYIELENFDAALEALEKGKNMIKSLMESQGVDLEMQRDIPRFYTKFGHILLKKAQMETNPKQRSEYLNDALEQLKKGMNIDEKLKMDHFELYNVKQKLKADVLIEKGDYDQALLEAKTALNLRRTILQPPHFKYMESVYQVAKIYLLTGNKCAEEARRWWLIARDYFKEMEDHHLVNGSIKVGHPLLDKIKHDHLEVRRLCDGENSESVKEVQEFYQKLEKGKFKSRADSHLESFQKMLHTPSEFRKQRYGSGGEKFGNNDIRMEETEKQIQRMRDGSYGVERQNSADSPSGSDTVGSVSSGDRISASTSPENRERKRSATSADNDEQAAKRPRTLVDEK